MPRLQTRDYDWGLNANGEISDYIRIPSWNPGNNAGLTLSVAGWAKPIGSSVSHNMCSKFDYGNAKRSWHIAVNNGNVRVTLSDSGSGLTKRYESVKKINDYKYHFIGFTWDGNTDSLKIHIDNDYNTTVTKVLDVAMTNLFQSDADVMLAAVLQNTSPRADWSGMLSAQWMYGDVLTLGEWNEMYFEGKYPTDDLEGHWDFQEGSGTTINDLSGNGHTGTLNGLDWIENGGAFRLRDKATNRTGASNRTTATNRVPIS
ncbi:hypothetical protein HN682_08125 [Candidatus Peregrinibacteria bacterium]|nr:hypothetical protein [Candidatus Peregrinibacteria bacterium]